MSEVKVNYYARVPEELPVARVPSSAAREAPRVLHEVQGVRDRG